MKAISSRVDEDLYDWLLYMAEREDKNISEIIRTLLDRIKLATEIKRELEEK